MTSVTDRLPERTERHGLLEDLSRDEDAKEICSFLTNKPLRESNILALILTEKVLSVPKPYRKSIMRKLASLRFYSPQENSTKMEDRQNLEAA